MLRILGRYVFREILTSSVLGTVLATFVVFLQKVDKLFEVLVAGNPDPKTVILLLAYTVPPVLPLTIPFGVLVGILIGLGLYLIQRRRIVRDGRTLLLLESVFLADLTFLNAQAGSVSFTTGLLVSLCVIALTAVKVTVIVRVLWSEVPFRLLGAILVTLRRFN